MYNRNLLMASLIIIICSFKSSICVDIQFFKENCWSTDFFLSQFDEFKQNQDNPNQDDLLTLLDIKYIKANKNLFLQQGEERDLFLGIYNDIIQIREIVKKDLKRENNLGQKYFESLNVYNKSNLFDSNLIDFENIDEDNNIRTIDTPQSLEVNKIQIKQRKLGKSTKGSFENELDSMSFESDDNLSSVQSERVQYKQKTKQIEMSQMSIRSMTQRKRRVSNNTKSIDMDEDFDNMLMQEHSEMSSVHNSSIDTSQITELHSKNLSIVNISTIDDNFANELAKMEKDKISSMQNHQGGTFKLLQQFYTLMMQIPSNRDYQELFDIYQLFFGDSDKVMLRGNLQKKDLFQKLGHLLPTVQGCVVSPGIANVSSQVGFLVQSVISMDYYFSVKGQYQWYLGKIFYDILESFEFIFDQV